MVMSRRNPVNRKMKNLSASKVQQFAEKKGSLIDAMDVDQRQLAALFQTGYRAFEQGRYEEARKILTGVLLLDRKNPFVYEMLGAIYKEEGRLEVAVACYNHLPQSLLSGEDQRAIIITGGSPYSDPQRVSRGSSSPFEKVALNPQPLPPNPLLPTGMDDFGLQYQALQEMQSAVQQSVDLHSANELFDVPRSDTAIRILDQRNDD